MTKNSFSVSSIILILLVSSCTNKDLVEPQMPITKPNIENQIAPPPPIDLVNNNIGGGKAFNINLQTGQNYRISDVVYQSTIQKFIRVEIPWFPTQRLPEPITRTFRVTYIFR